jgi:hypothetical protein
VVSGPDFEDAVDRRLGGPAEPGEAALVAYRLELDLAGLVAEGPLHPAEPPVPRGRPLRLRPLVDRFGLKAAAAREALRSPVMALRGRGWR